MRTFSANERRLTVATTILVVGWLALSGAILPLWDRLGLLHQQAEGSWEKLARLQGLVDNRQSIDQRYRRYAEFFSEASDEALHSEFLDELERLAGAGGLQLNLKPLPVEREGRLSRITVELEVDGTQEAILDFLDQLLASPDLMDVERFRLATTASEERPVQASLVVTKLVLRHPSVR